MLKLNSLYLKHFMCIDEAKLNFDANCIIIEGDNGQGKSAIMEAVAICLSERKRSDSVKEFVQKGYEHAKIILDLTYNNEDIHFDVNLNLRAGTPLERDVLYKGKHYINSEVTTLINDLEFTFYSDIIISMQGADDITIMTPTQRLNLLQRLFQFDFSEQIKPIEDKIDNAAKNKIVNSEKIDFLEKANNKSRQTLDTLVEKSYEFSKEEYDIFKKELEKRRIDLDKSNDALEKINKTLQDKAVLSNKIRELENEKQSLIDKIEESNQAVKDAEKIDYENKKVEAEKIITGLSDNIESITKSIADNKDKLSEIRSNRSNIAEMIGTTKAVKLSLLKKLEVAAKGVCPECGQSTCNIHTEQIEQEKDEAESKLIKYSKDVEEQEKIENDISKKTADLRTEMAEKNRLLSEKKAALSTALALYTQAMSKVLKDEEIEKLDNEIKEYEAEIIKHQQEVDRFNDVIEEANKLSLKRNDLKIVIEDLNNKITSSDEIHEHNKIIGVQRVAIQNSVTENESTIKELRSNISQIDVDVQTYNEVLKVLNKELPNYLVVKTCTRLEQEMNNFVNVVFPLFRLRLLQSKRGVEFFYTTDPNADMTDLKKLINAKMASGYERSILGLAFKIALCRAYGLSFIALDEIDAAASEGNSVLTMESLINSNIFSQIFFITHKEATRDVIKSLCDSVVSYHVSKGVFTDEEAD